MANWKTFKITLTFRWHEDPADCTFYLDNYVSYSDGNYDRIHCSYTSPFKDWGTGDYIEIDLDKIKYKSYDEKINDVSIVRKVSSSTNIVTTRGSSSDVVVSPSAANFINSQAGLDLAQGMSRMVDETGKSFEHKIEVESKDGKKISYSLICRKD